MGEKRIMERDCGRKIVGKRDCDAKPEYHEELCKVVLRDAPRFDTYVEHPCLYDPNVHPPSFTHPAFVREVNPWSLVPDDDNVNVEYDEAVSGSDYYDSSSGYDDDDYDGEVDLQEHATTQQTELPKCGTQEADLCSKNKRKHSAERSAICENSATQSFQNDDSAYDDGGEVDLQKHATTQQAELPKCGTQEADLSSKKRKHSAGRSPIRENSASSSRSSLSSSVKEERKNQDEEGLQRAGKDDQMLDELERMISCWISAGKVDHQVLDEQQRIASSRHGYWERLLALKWWVKIDGCFRKPEKGGGYGGFGGYGAIVYDNTGKEIVAAAGVSERPVSNLYHKLQGVKLGLKLAKEYGCAVVELSTNSLYAVNVASMPYDPTQVPPLVLPIMEEIRQLSSEFTFLHINYLFKDQNRAADYLASLGKTIKFEPHEFPEELRQKDC
ncbi:hypothetical protein BVC80_1513g32 [Macleaya cordata]|uniref:RNase H type-1 domain-containing protein n=1 Tax=Macleaya cordata TaxID=56857 RepID=A0A200PTD1_MACCD|nr:hypothetical protein BVC80_1513g32 [Macleaya cordata]